MTVLNILSLPDPRLRKVALPVLHINKSTLSIIEDMCETMYKNEGIGLAATQVNINYRIIVIDISENRNNRLVLINPIILEKNGISNIEEGCLSIPNERAIIQRSQQIKICALNCKNNLFEINANGLLSICIQHEIDHLNGKLFIDYLSPLKKQRIIKKFQKLSRYNCKREL